MNGNVWIAIVTSLIQVILNIIRGEVARCLQRAVCLGVETRFDKPFFLTIFADGALIILILPLYFYFVIQDIHPTMTSLINSQKFTWYSLLSLGFLTALLRKGDWAYYLSLNYIDFSIATGLYYSSFALIYIFSILFLGERIRKKRLLACFVATLGLICFMMNSTQDDEDNPVKSQSKKIIGCLIGILPAFCFAFYCTLYTYVISKVNITSTFIIHTITSLNGVFTMSLILPFL
eukprot:UN29613